VKDSNLQAIEESDSCEPDTLASKTPSPGPNPVMRDMTAAASRNPEVPGQKREAGRRPA
jgi:hypothetical protein